MKVEDDEEEPNPTLLARFIVVDDDNVDDDLVAAKGPDDFVPIIETLTLFEPGRAGKSSELMVNSLCALSIDDD